MNGPEFNKYMSRVIKHVALAFVVGGAIGIMALVLFILKLILKW